MTAPQAFFLSNCNVWPHQCPGVQILLFMPFWPQIKTLSPCQDGQPAQPCGRPFSPVQVWRGQPCQQVSSGSLPSTARCAWWRVELGCCAPSPRSSPGSAANTRHHSCLMGKLSVKHLGLRAAATAWVTMITNPWLKQNHSQEIINNFYKQICRYYIGFRITG